MNDFGIYYGLWENRLTHCTRNSKAIGYLPKRYLREKTFETGAFSLFWIRLPLQLENAMGNKE